MNVLKSHSKFYPLFTMLLGFFAFLIAGSITLVTFYISKGNGLFSIFYLIELNIIVPAISGLLLSLLLGIKKERLRMTAACVIAYLIIAFFVRMILNMTLYNMIYDNDLLRIIIGSIVSTTVFTIIFGLIVYGLNKKVILMLMESEDITQMIGGIIWVILLNIIYGNLMIGIALYFGKIKGPFRFWFYTLICGITAIPFGILSYMIRYMQFWGIYLSPLIITVSLGICTGLCIGLSSRQPAIMKRFVKN